MKITRRGFLASSGSTLLTGGAILGGFNPLQRALADERDNYGFMGGGKWRNWTGNVRMKPQRIVRPSTLEELQDVVSKSGKIRAVGSGHSISTIAFTDQTLMNTQDLSGILHVDKERQTIKIRAGTKLHYFNDLAAKHDLVIPSTGDTTYQSLGGLLSTGTHGTGMKWGSCSDEESLVGMELIRPDGSLLSLSQDRAEDREMLAAARVSLGSFGIVYSVTLKLAPLHNLEHQGRKARIEDAFDSSLLEKNDHYEFSYFPYTDQCYQFFRNKTDKPITATPLKTWFNEDFLQNDLAKILMEGLSLVPSKAPDVMKAFVQNFPESQDIDRADRIMTIKRKTPAYLMEFALPIHAGPQAVERYRAVLSDFSKKSGHERFFVTLPSQVRFVRADRGTLISCAEGRDTCWFGLGSHISLKGHEPFFRAMEKELLKLGGKPHWGKCFFENPMDLHPGFKRWAELQSSFDPAEKFQSDYLKRLKSYGKAPSKGVF